MERAEAFFFVINIVAFVLATVGPLEHTGALHFVVTPHAFVLAPVRPIVDTCEQSKVRFR